MTWYQDLQNPVARDEATIIVEEFGRRGVTIGGVAQDGGVGFMYAEGQLLAREQYLGNLEAPLARRGFQARVARRVIKDIVLLDILPVESGGKSADGNDSAPQGNDENREGNGGQPDGNGDTAEDGQPPLVRLVNAIEAELGLGIVTLNHVLSVQGSPHPCPATEPQEVHDPKPYPPRCPRGGARVRIYVADTGWVSDTATTCPWLNGVSGDNDPRVEADRTILHYGAHGTFVAGVIRCLAPEAEIVVKNVFNIAGSALEADFVPELRKGFDYGAEIFHLTVASPTMHNRPLLAFGTWLEELRQHKGVVCVVAAGNNGSWLPSWPAAFRGVISVGALSADRRRRAGFSNYGSWVDVYAPGEDLVNAFATGRYKCQVFPYAGNVRTFSGMAQWSGTSFSTPVVTGLIAARMARRGESAEQASAALLAGADAQTIPGVGPVLLPSCGGKDDEVRRPGLWPRSVPLPWLRRHG